MPLVWLKALAALASAIPKIIELILERSRENRANAERAAKNERNQAAIDAARRDPAP